MPAVKVICAVSGVEHPSEVHQQWASHYSLDNEFAETAIGRRIAIVKVDAHSFARPLNGIVDATEFLDINRQRLFGDDIATKLHRPSNIKVMSAFHGGDDHDVGV